MSGAAAGRHRRFVAPAVPPQPQARKSGLPNPLRDEQRPCGSRRWVSLRRRQSSQRTRILGILFYPTKRERAEGQDRQRRKPRTNGSPLMSIIRNIRREYRRHPIQISIGVLVLLAMLPLSLWRQLLAQLDWLILCVDAGAMVAAATLWYRLAVSPTPHDASNVTRRFMIAVFLALFAMLCVHKASVVMGAVLGEIRGAALSGELLVESLSNSGLSQLDNRDDERVLDQSRNSVRMERLTYENTLSRIQSSLWTAMAALGVVIVLIELRWGCDLGRDKSVIDSSPERS